MKKIKITHNEYEKICKKLSSKIWAKDDTKITYEEYEKELNKYEIIPYILDNKQLEKIINKYCYADKNRNGYIEYIGKWLTESIIYKDDIKELFDKQIINTGYYCYKYSLRNLCDFTYCEGDIYINVYDSKENFIKSLEETKKFIKENY